MKKAATVVAMLAYGVLPGAGTAFAQTAAQNSQQQKMKACNAQAADKKGDDRKAFMKDCLSAGGGAPAKMTQQERMKACNQQAGDKKGDDRKAFMKQCLSNKG